MTPKLTQPQIQKLPQPLRVVLQRFEHEPQLFMKIKQLLVQSAQKVQQQSLNHDTFCNTFQVPRALPQELLKLYGMTERDCRQAMQKIGFIEIHRQYNDIYYQTMCIAYLVGLAKGDENIRKMALLLIDIRLWNGRKLKSFPTFCDPDTARYVLNYALKGNHTLKKAGSSFDYIDKFSIPAVDSKYAPTISNNLDSDTEGLRKLIDTNFVRIYQLFNSVKRAYYKAIEEGKKEVVGGKYGNQYGDGDMVEQRDSFSGNIERLSDKIVKNSVIKRNVILKPESIAIFKERYNFSETALREINKWFMDEENDDEIKYYYELLFTHLKPKNEGDICQYDVPVLANMVTSSKKDQYLLKAKEILDHVLIAVVGEQKFKNYGIQSLYRARAIVALAFSINAKIHLCKKL